MKDFHPEVKKFWEDNGWKIIPWSIWDVRYKTIKSWIREKAPTVTEYGLKLNSCIVARFFEIDGELQLRYFLDPFDKKMYSEDEMLRVIKMKAFI